MPVVEPNIKMANPLVFGRFFLRQFGPSADSGPYPHLAWPRDLGVLLKVPLDSSAQALKSVGSALSHTPAIRGGVLKGFFFLSISAVWEPPEKAPGPSELWL